MNITVWLSHDNSVGQRQSFRGGPDERIDEEVSHSSSALNDLPSPDQQVGREAEKNVGEQAEGILLNVHDGLGKYLPQVLGAYNSTQHSTTGISPFMILTGKERAMPLTFFYPDYEGKKTSPQAYVKEAIRGQQELNELCMRNTAQAQMRQRKKYDKKILQAKPYAVGEYVWVFQNVIPPKGTK